MKRIGINFIAMSLLLFNIAMGQDFSGQYYLQSQSGSVTLALQADGQGGYHGALSGNDNSFPLQGTVENGLLIGALGDQGIVFQAQFTEGSLTLIMVETDAYGNLNPATAQTLTFQRQTGETPSTSEPQAPGTGQVIINNTILSDEQIAEIEKTYGVKPQTGKYWYDARSGLYGVVGYPAYGFMLPGHTFGALERSASNGQTGVFVNGRELPQTEWAVWSYMIGYWIQPGSYWLDNNGNAGYEGNPTPVINLYAAAQQNAYRGQGGSGDNFWSTRFSAGNSDSGNQRGYVSVPGYGPVGYGF